MDVHAHLGPPIVPGYKFLSVKLSRVSSSLGIMVCLEDLVVSCRGDVHLVIVQAS